MRSRFHSRRGFLTAFGMAAGMTSAGCGGKRWLSSEVQTTVPSNSSLGLLSSADRAGYAYRVRHLAALAELQQSSPQCATNGDDERYPSRLASYSKGLPHDDSGAVDPGAYNKLLAAIIHGGTPTHLAAIPMGGSLKQVNPQAAHAFALHGADSHRLDLPPAPAFASGEAAAEMAELYWHSVLRDTPFA